MNDHFVYGFCFAVVVISIVLATQYGDYFNYLKNDAVHIVPTFGEALNWKTAVTFSIVFAIFFKNAQGHLLNRLYMAGLLLAVSWAIFDFFWIFKASVMGVYLFGGSNMVTPTMRELFISICRNGVILLFGAVDQVYKCWKISKTTLLTILVFCAYWIFLLLPAIMGFKRSTSPAPVTQSPFVLLFYQPFFYFFNFLPFATAFKERVGKSWKRFLWV